MAKLNTRKVTAQKLSPITTTGSVVTNAYGARGHARDIQSELFMLAVANLGNQKTFHEQAAQRDSRFSQLVRTATLADPEWTGEFLRWLRTEANMRTASTIGAMEYGRTCAEHKIPGARPVIAAALDRADEPMNALAYWLSTHGRKIPMAVKRGIGDAATKLFTEKSYIKHDSTERGVRMSDVLELCHPVPKGPLQSTLFRYILFSRRDRSVPVPIGLSTIRNYRMMMNVTQKGRRSLATRDRLRDAGMTWESVGGWLQGPMDGAIWSELIPVMGFGALVRNLRNFDDAGITDEAYQYVAARLSDPEQVRRSQMFPYRFHSAWKATGSMRWGMPLEAALNASLSNVPQLRGSTLVLVDCSPSMYPDRYWRGNQVMPDMNPTKVTESEVSLAEKAAIFGSAIALRSEHATLVGFGGESKEIPFRKGDAVLKMIERFGIISYTETDKALRAHYAGHDRVVIVTDEQTGNGSRWYGGPNNAAVGNWIPEVPIYTWNLEGYKAGHAPSGSGKRHTFGGLSDASFGMIRLLEANRDAVWPWMLRREVDA